MPVVYDRVEMFGTFACVSLPVIVVVLHIDFEVLPFCCHALLPVTIVLFESLLLTEPSLNAFHILYSD
jgi:hypothetical protein